MNANFNGHYLLELAIWVLLAYFIGCLLSALLRRMFAADEPAVATPSPMPRVQPEPVPAPVYQPEPIKAPEPGVADVVPAAVMPLRMERPQGLAKPRADKPDNLQQLSGVGPKNEAILHTLGFFHFDQIAAWTPEQIAWVDDHLRFNGRIEREEWVEQAKLLAEGRMEEFHRLYGTGGLKNRSGDTESGTRTRRS
ncbi:hypothetical protein [Aestuariivirga sp.]|uniref:hypothetical protein n=1 Tax=Aestuariivirga sp. TaxID=2650926 RepID=UPI0039E492A5